MEALVVPLHRATWSGGGTRADQRLGDCCWPRADRTRV